MHRTTERSQPPSLARNAYYTPLQVAALTTAKPFVGRPPMSPIYNLPVELLSRVFTLGMPEGDYPDFPQSDEVPFEMLVSHVCRHWRNVAIRTHHLWSTIHFRLVLHLERAQEYIVRSQPCLIDILVDTCAAEEYRPGINLFRNEFRPVFNLTTPHIQRWRSLSLKVRDSGCKMGAREVLSNCGGAPNLEYLQLWHIENWESPERLYTQIGPPPVVVFDKHLPALKHIVLIGVNVPWPQSPFLEDLSTVEFALHSEHVRIPYDIWANMLATSPNLYKLSLHYSGPRSEPDGWPPGVVELPGLRELILTDLDCSYILQLFERLSVPNVTHLRIELNDRDQDFSELFGFFAQPVTANTESGADNIEEETPRGPVFPSLESLTIAALDCSPESFRAFLRSTPSIRHLELSGTKMTPGLFQQLFTCSAPSAAANSSSSKGKQRDSSASGVEQTASFSYDVRQAGRSGTRASSSDTARSHSSTRTLSTAATSPRSVDAPLDPLISISSSSSSPRAPTGGECMLLPALESLRVSGVSPALLGTLIRFRRRFGRPLARWYVNERMRDDGLERLAEEMARAGGADEQLVWFEGDDDEDDAESEGYTDDGQRLDAGAEPWGVDDAVEDDEHELYDSDDRLDGE